MPPIASPAKVKNSPSLARWPQLITLSFVVLISSLLFTNPVSADQRAQSVYVVNGMVIDPKLPKAGLKVREGVNGIDIMQVPNEYLINSIEIEISSPALAHSPIKLPFQWQEVIPLARPAMVTIPFCVNAANRQCANSSSGKFAVQVKDSSGQVLSNSVYDLN